MSVGLIGAGDGVMRVGDALQNGGQDKADDAARIVQQLRDRLERDKQRRARRAGWTRRFTPTRLAPLDSALPHGGLPCGAITEILADGFGVGAMSLAIRIAGNTLRQTAVHAASAGSAEDGRRIVLIDTFKDFYPPAVRQHGVALDRLIVLRVTRAREVLWAVEQALRCSAIAAVIASFVQLEECDSRRLQLAAESSGCLGLILRSASHRSKSFAATQMLIEGVRAEEWMGAQSGNVRWMEPGQASRLPARGSAFVRAGAGDAHVCRITLLKIREGMPVEPLLVDLQHETGALPLHPLPVDRSAAKTG